MRGPGWEDQGEVGKDGPGGRGERQGEVGKRREDEGGGAGRTRMRQDQRDEPEMGRDGAR